ncbi:hypothetical protein FQA39_LY02028 [Lamprigera yunnana]|nr:hypothetical protein FQA39_LY02028 [Lamprigera yunnana]
MIFTYIFIALSNIAYIMFLVKPSLRINYKNVCRNLNSAKKILCRENSNIVYSPFPNVEIPDILLPHFIFQNFDQVSNKVAVECDLTGKKYTFDEIRTKSINFSTNLRKKLKLNNNDIVAVILPNVPDFPICVLGAMQAGIAITPLDVKCTPDEISYQISALNVKAIVTLNQLYHSVKRAINITKRSIPILTVKLQQTNVTPEGALDFNEFINAKAQVEEQKDLSPDSLAVLPYTSGTTGKAKGVHISHRNLVANLCQFNAKDIAHHPVRSENHENLLLGILPWSFSFGSTVGLFNHLYNLSKIVSTPNFTVKGFIDAIMKHKPNLLYVVPSLFLLMSTNPAFKTETLDSVQVILSSSSPLGSKDEEFFLNKVKKDINILQVYGLTETQAVLFQTVETKRRLKLSETNYALLPNTSIKIISKDNNTSTACLGPNEAGEILIKGPQITKGYYNCPSKTEEAFSDGWLKTGDLGYYDKNRFFCICDRIKDLIKVNGVQVAPAELEELVRTYDNVEDVAVIGIPHSKYGEIPLAYVVPHLNNKLSVDGLQQYVSERVANYKHLKGGVIVVDSLPRNSVGKVLRNELKSEYLSRM